jgi:hypothetical protein
MALNGLRAACDEFHFDRSASDGSFTTATNGTGAVSFTGNHNKGVQMSVTALADRAFIHFNNRLVYNIDDLKSIEFLFRIEAWHSFSDAILGLCSTYNADPDAIQEGIWFRIGGGAGDKALFIESDDNVTNIDDEPTGITLADNGWFRGRIAFDTGIQSIAPPGGSKGGKASVQFEVTDSKGFCRHISPPKHIDMSAYAGGLQPVIGVRQMTSNAGAAVSLFLKRIRIEHCLPA